MTLNPNENQAEKHSPTPWITGTMLKHVVYDANAIIACDCGHRSNAECSDANAARIVACVNFCRNVPDEYIAEGNSYTSSSACGPLQSIINQLEELKRTRDEYRAKLSTLRKELEAAKRAQAYLFKYGIEVFDALTTERMESET